MKEHRPTRKAEHKPPTDSNEYVRISLESETENYQELEAPNETPGPVTRRCQALLWLLAGGGLVGFALWVLWWDPISCPNHDLRPHSQQQQDASRSIEPEGVWEKFLQEQEECNPFQEKGYLHFNASDPGDNTWRPYRQTCKSSNLFEQLKQGLQMNQNSFPQDRHDSFEWLRNRTVVLIGDSIDRYHNLDFCQILSWAPGSTSDNPIPLPNPPTKTYYIEAASPLSPPPWHFHLDDPLRPPDDWPEHEHDLFKFQTPIWDSGKSNANTTRPRVCEIPAYGFTMVNLFNWGLDPKHGGRLYANISGYYPPAKYTSRIEHVLKPLLENLASHLNNPLITKPDLIEMNSGFWDLRQWSEEDIAADSENLMSAAFGDLSVDRLSWWSERQKQAIKYVSEIFPETQTPILWRSLHHVQKHYWVAYDRVFQLDQLARYNIEEIKKSDPSLNARLRIDEWGALMLGQEAHFRDVLHVAALPGGVLWGDMMLWELKRAVQKRGYSYYNS
ncbi:hypothetical protein O181_032887 [Austropuccinia psidii MF-1]|uniref:Uncharacterized protein n=1 Tax=Austropuccinia psidii MF-1 TaxID=1389203 RepID=A0A9Q3D3H0_9BASI|nr:hypothetical protein [Austropuccinia psidii MF-1]